MTRAEWIADRGDLLRETDAIERDLKRIEQQYGARASVEDVRRLRRHDVLDPSFWQ